jgi:N-acylneuraminate cytidylyltransferase
MSRIAIITARGGSKRIPKKNIKDFCGKPIIAYSIQAAIESGLFDEVMVSTDSKEIADISIKYGAKVPFMRSEATSGDYATTEDVLLEVLSEYEHRGMSFDVLCCLYPTAPFVTASKLNQAIKLLDDSDAVVPVVKFSFPPQRGIVNRNGYLAYQFPECAMTRSQDLEPIYHDCGQFYFCKVDALKKERDLICSRSVMIEISEEQVQDIDNDSDWAIAEMKYNLMIRKERS